MVLGGNCYGSRPLRAGVFSVAAALGSVVAGRFIAVSFLEIERHCAVIDAGIVEQWTISDEAMPFVEPDGTDLGMQEDPRQPSRSGDLDQVTKQGTADAAAAIGWQYGHSTDVPIRQQARGPDRVTIRPLSDDMVGVGVMVVPFELRRDALFIDEHGEANL